MRLRLLTFLAPLLSSIICGTNADVSVGGGDLYPPGYLPLVNRANALLTAGQFSDAAKSYSEALGALRLIYTNPKPHPRISYGTKRLFVVL